MIVALYWPCLDRLRSHTSPPTSWGHLLLPSPLALRPNTPKPAPNRGAEENSWVQIGDGQLTQEPTETCRTYEQAFSRKPVWGLQEAFVGRTKSTNRPDELTVRCAGLDPRSEEVAGEREGSMGFCTDCEMDRLRLVREERGIPHLNH